MHGALVPVMKSGTDGGLGVNADPVRQSGLATGRSKTLGLNHGANEAFRIEDRFVLEHEVNCAREFDRQDGIRLELVALEARLEALGHGTDDGVIAFGNHGRFAKGPPQVRVAEFGAAQPFDLAGAGHGAFDQPAICSGSL